MSRQSLTAGCLAGELPRSGRTDHGGYGAKGTLATDRDGSGTTDVRDIESALIEEVVRLSDHNKTLAAKYLGLTRFALDRRLKKQLEHES